MHRITTGVFLGLWLAAAAAPAAADTFPSQALGIAPERAYQAGNVDSVNLFNGNLMLALQIGQRYPVGGSFSYGLHLTYNSGAWDYVVTDFATGQIAAYPRRNSNAGMGWLLTLGQLQEPNDPLNTTQQWLYTGPDSAEHRFYLRLHEEDPQTGGRQYTRDGTYIRLRGIYANGTVVYLDFPDGTLHTFTRFGIYDWRLTNVSDPFNNNLAVNYPTDLQWVINDSANRTLTVNFEPAQGYAKRVQSVTVPVFGNTTATYTFRYTGIFLPRACPNNDPANPQATVSFLSSVTLPDGSSWSMPSYVAGPPADCRTYGDLLTLVLPTLGQLQWSYGEWTFPNPGDPHTWRTFSSGVISRSEVSAAGAVLGAWSYAPSLTGPIGSKAVEAVRLVTTPLNQTTAHYFSVALQSANGWNRAEYGLPISHNQSDGGSLSVSTLAYPCAVSDPANPPCSPLRTTYLGYSEDTPSITFGGDLTADTNYNQRVSGSRTTYNDDGATTAAVAYSNFDGLGHYRQAADSGTFPAGNIRTAATDFNPSNGTYPGSFTLPNIQGPWVLGTSDWQTVADGASTSKVETCFEPATGFLNRKRILQTGSSEGPHDLLRTYSSLGGGNVTAEDDFGGDTQDLTVLCPSTCACSLGTGQYHVDNTYAKGSLATSRYAGASFFSANGTIDPNTGLVSSSQDSSGLTTSYGYDTLGRLTSKIPPDAVATTYTYTPASTSNQPTVDITTNATHSMILFDDFGRLWREARLDPAAWNYRETLYDPAGNKLSVSEWGRFRKQTQYLNYDPFGRPQLIQPPDGGQHTISLVYHGVRQIDRKVPIAGAAGERLQTTSEIYDRQGRLVQVNEPPGGTVTSYGYDVGNRLTFVSSSGSGATQARRFYYDNRGFLNSEQHPEKGATGGGFVTYSGYDARGHVGQTTDGPNNLSFTYDAAERLTGIQDANRANRPLKAFIYSQANGSGAGYSLGKLLQSSRYNYVVGDGASFKVEIRHNYAYGDLTPPFQAGRVTNRTTQFVINDGPTAAEMFAQSFAYDSLGNVSTLTYPQCIAGGCGGASGARSVNFSYTRDLLTGVSGYTSGAGITYSPSLQVNQVQHANGVLDTVAPDPNYMPRPASLTSALGASTLWSTGAYAYDGAGNVTTIGPAAFVYDPVSRLASGTVYLEATNPVTPASQGYGYDAFGNLTSVGNANTPTDTGTNRLTGAIYDAAGNMANWNGQNYAFDALNQMIRFCAGTCLTGAGQTGEDWTYMYDADGERVWTHKNFQNAFRRTLRDLAGHVLRDNLSGDVSSTEDYIYRNGQLLAAETPTGTQHFSLDHLGTPRLVTNAAGSRVAYHVYFPFGREATPIAQDGERMKFTGHERDLGNPLSDQDDLDYMHARHFNPQLARFLSVDSTGTRVHRPQSWNLYAYVEGGPETFVDPDGLLAFPRIPMPVGDVLTDYVDAEGIFATATADPSHGTTTNPNTGLAGLNALLLAGGPSFGNDADPHLHFSDFSAGRFFSLWGKGLAAYVDGLLPVVNPLEAAGLYNLHEVGMGEMRMTGAVVAVAAPVVAGPVVVAEGAVKGATGLGAKIADALFGGRGLVNANRYFRVGYGRASGTRVFRASGEFVARFKEGGHIIIWRFGLM
jgi:RHS repeat-associated protein